MTSGHAFSETQTVNQLRLAVSSLDSHIAACARSRVDTEKAYHLQVSTQWPAKGKLTASINIMHACIACVILGNSETAGLRRGMVF